MQPWRSVPPAAVACEPASEPNRGEGVHKSANNGCQPFEAGMSAHVISRPQGCSLRLGGMPMLDAMPVASTKGQSQSAPVYSPAMIHALSFEQSPSTRWRHTEDATIIDMIHQVGKQWPVIARCSRGSPHTHALPERLPRCHWLFDAPRMSSLMSSTHDSSQNSH
jgi:hypothetical protein